jgi:type VI secretion system secreted protein VgrG
MATYQQVLSPLAVATPLGPDDLLLVGFSGHEAISHLFSFQLDLVAENQKTIAFDKVLGQNITVRLAVTDDEERFFNGMCNRFSQGSRDDTFTSYRMEIVPQFWLLTRRAQSRIFQRMSVPDILKKVLEGLDVTYEIQGTFEKRDYCVQYRETDFNFASRLMEEEGIYYFFKHTNGSHKLVLANTPQSHPDLPGNSTIIYEELGGGNRADQRIFGWEKVQELRSGKVTLWDHCFELPHKHLEADKTILDTVSAGEVTHKLKVGGNDKLELYDYPGEYAQRFDGIDRGGGEQPAEIQKIYTDNKRTVGLRMEEEALPSLVIQADSNVREVVTGYKFTLDRHFNADGDYVITSASHTASASDYRSNGSGGFEYSNHFTCIPFALPYRPARTTPKPFVQGTQTAVVVGPKGEEIFTDKYGRVKVQFHWDRQGKYDADSSCWVRVAQQWAGKRWGSSFWPRIGQEVIVAFQEGDPDQPIIVGNVYNADQQPPYLGSSQHPSPDSKHPNDNKLTGVKSNSTTGGVGFNEWRFDDTKGKEQVFIHAERNMDTRVKNDSMERVIGNRHLIVGSERDGKKSGDQNEMVLQDKNLNIKRNHVEQIEGNMQLMIGHGEAKDGGNLDVVVEKTKKELIEKDNHLHIKGNHAEQVDGSWSLTIGGDETTSIGGKAEHHVKGDRNEKVDNNQSLTVGQSQQEKVGTKHALEAGQEIHLKAGMKVILEAGMQLTIKGPGGFVDIGPSGVTIQGIMVLINSGGSAGSGSGSSPTAPQDAAAPQDPQQAQPAKPAEADDAKTGQKSAPG